MIIFVSVNSKLIGHHVIGQTST